MRLQILAAALALGASCTAVEQPQVDKVKHLHKKAAECAEWDVAVAEKGSRHQISYIIPKCMKWKPQENEPVHYDLDVVKVMHGCAQWNVAVSGIKITPVCSKVQKRIKAQAADAKEHGERPEPEVLSMEPLFAAPGKKCTSWKGETIKPGDEKILYPSVYPKCKKWKKHHGEDITYDLTTVHLVPGCHYWKTGAVPGGTETDISTWCAKYKGMPKAGNLEIIKRSDSSSPTPAAAHRGLLKDVQISVHTLQSQLAQIQHRHQSLNAANRTPGHDGASVSNADSSNPNHDLLQRLQQTVQAMQSKLAKAKHMIHAHFATKRNLVGKKTEPEETGVLNQGVLQDLQHSVHQLQAELAEARHQLHAEINSIGTSKKLASSGFDQGNLQAMQHTTNTLQSQLAQARHTLHAHISGGHLL